jgi:glycosyltransferase involved in cell wall biosynthesis
LRIGIFISALPPEHHGGAELQADRMARELAARGHEVHVFARGRRAAAADRNARRGARPPAPGDRCSGLRLVAEVVQGAVQAARTRPDVLLCYMTINSGLLGAATSVLSGAPYVVWQRSDANHWRTRRHGNAASPSGCTGTRRPSGCRRQPSRLRCATRMKRPGMGGLGARRTAHPHPRQRARPAGRDGATAVPPPAFVFVGRLVEQKDVPTLVAAATQCPKRHS